MNFEFKFTDAEVVVIAKNPDTGVLHRLLRKRGKADLQRLAADDRSVAFAIADLRALADIEGEFLSVDADRIVMSHKLAACLDAEAGDLLGLPPFVDLVLKTDVEGILGSSGFRIRYEWSRNGQRQMPQRIGAVLQTANGLRRLPFWMLEAIAIADNYEPGKGDAVDWEALARFRNALEPQQDSEPASDRTKLSMTDFLKGLEVQLVDRFSISPKSATEFDVVPFSGKNLAAQILPEGDGSISESMGELDGLNLKHFQTMVRRRGAMPAYRLDTGRYVAVDRSAAPALDVMAHMMKAAPHERANFIKNPLPLITEALEASLRASGKLNGLSPDGEQEAIEAAIGPVFIETKEYSERVTGVVKYEKPDIEGIEPSGTSWLPEDFSRQIGELLSRQSFADLAVIRDEVADAIKAGRPTVNVEAIELPARPEMLKLIDDKISAQQSFEAANEPDEDEESGGPFVLDTEVNYADLKWLAKMRPRSTDAESSVPEDITTPLKDHQIGSFNWQVKAWRAGLPGILNADEQGLGKTLQTISFLVWLKMVIADPKARSRGPVLIVAPTSLLENWEQEVSRHVEGDGMGHLVRLYGSSLGGHKASGMRGIDTQNGVAKLDLGALYEAIDEGRAHRFWFLTTYTTLTNYQHSLAKIPFSAAVFDEIQALKNPISLRAVAARAMNADFRIGLTGTPIENSTVDLWAIMDQVAAGSLGSLKDFRSAYSSPEEGNMSDLHSRVFHSVGGKPAMAIRRLKETVAKELPEKSRRLLPRLMPELQAVAYDDARLKLASGAPGSQLKMLHHIRSVSVHPTLNVTMTNNEFIAASGRLDATMEILKQVKAKGERVLVFIEHRQMQYRFIELVRSELGLARVDLINGDTPIPQRQAIVNRFQRHLLNDQGFDMLVLGPKAAGTGLTLTAATHVIHLSRWWNPAVEEQCNDRVHRIGQVYPVTIHVPMAIHPGYREHSFDCLLQSLMTRKRRLASSALWPMGDTDGDIAELQKLMAEEQKQSQADALTAAIAAMYARDGIDLPAPSLDGSYAFA